MTRTFDADDLVSEAYVRIYAATVAGKGPTGPFRPYLLVTIRNIAARWAKQRHGEPLEDADEIPDQRLTDDPVLATVDAELTARAFGTLPERWQQVLWLTEVEGLPTPDVASRLGMTVSGVGMLALRAREGLRQAWIQAHIDTSGVDAEHSWVLQHVGQSARGKLRLRAKTRFDEHLASCADCKAVAAEAVEISNQFTLTFVPLSVGVLAVTGLSMFLDVATPTGTAHADTTMQAADSRKDTDQAPRRGSVVLLVVGSLVLLALVGAAIASAVVFTHPGTSAAVGPASSAEIHPVIPSPSTAADESTPPETPSPTPTPTPTPSQRQEDDPPTAESLPAATSAPISPPVQHAQVPTITRADTADGALYPAIEGTARPGVTVTLTVTSTSSTSATVTADADGRWMLPMLETATGTVVITAYADGNTSAPATVHVSRPQLFVNLSSHIITVRGAVNTHYTVRLDGLDIGIVTTDAAGSGTLPVSVLDPTTAHSIAVNAVDGARTGPPVSLPVAAQG